jgi:hypothetical protein
LTDSSVAEQLSAMGEVTSAGQSGNCFARWALEKILPIDPIGWVRSPDMYLNALTGIAGVQKVCRSSLGGRRYHDSNLSMQNVLDFRAVTILPRLYRAIGEFVGQKTLEEDYHPRPMPYHWLSRLISLRVNKAHAFPDDTVAGLAREAIRSIRLKRATGFGRRLCLFSALVVIVTFPPPLLRAILPVSVSMMRLNPLLTVRKILRGKANRPQHWRAAFSQAEPSGRKMQASQ